MLPFRKAEQLVHARWPTEIVAHACKTSIRPTVSDTMTCSIVITWQSQQQPSSYGMCGAAAHGRSEFLTVFQSCDVLVAVFQSGQIVHTRWPTEILAHACVKATTIHQPFYVHLLLRRSIDSCHVLLQVQGILLSCILSW